MIEKKDPYAHRGAASAERAEEADRLNLTLPEERPAKAPALRASRPLPRWPVRKGEPYRRWTEAVIRRLGHEAKEAPRRTLILLEGPRASGAHALFAEAGENIPRVDLDRPDFAADADDSPRTFLARHAGAPALIIERAHRAPRLLEALWRTAGTPPAEGGPAPKIVVAGVCARPESLLAADLSAAPLGGLDRVRIRTVAQGEFTGVGDDFPERLLELDFPNVLSHDESNRDLVLEEAMRGGYPEGRFGTPDERHDFFHGLVREICSKDLPLVSRVQSSLTLRKVYRLLGASSGEVLNLTQFASILGIGRPLVRRCVEALESLYMVERLAPWPEGLSIDRAVKSDRHFVCDSGWLCGLLGFCSVDPRALPAGSQPVVRRLISGWTYAQLAALIDHRPEWRLWHFAVRTGLVVEFLLENRRTGRLIAIRTSPSERAAPEDFADLVKFRALVPHRRVSAALLYCGQSLRRFEGVGAAVPLAFLWR